MTTELRDALRELADAADTVGVKHFDGDENSPEVDGMQAATLRARAILTADDQRAASPEQDSRAMFVARLEEGNRDEYLKVSDVLALLKDCDLLASMTAAPPQAAAQVPAVKESLTTAHPEAQPSEPQPADDESVDKAWLRFCLENCRLLAARHRREEWAQHIIRFCAEAKVNGSPLRAARASAPQPVAQPGAPT